MGSYRVERVNELIKNELASIIQDKLKDPRIAESLISITSAKTTPDMKYCKVYVAIYSQTAERKQIMEVLEGAKGFLRKEIAGVLTTRFAPELIFVLDDSIDYAMHIEKLLMGIKENEK